MQQKDLFKNPWCFHWLHFLFSVSKLWISPAAATGRLQEEALLNISQPVQSIPTGRGGRLICSNRHLEWRFLRLSAPASA